MQTKNPTTRAEKLSDLLQEAMKNPGVKEVLELYDASLGNEDMQNVQITLQEVYLKSSSDTSTEME